MRARPVVVLIKALCLFVLLNTVFAFIHPAIADISVYNTIFPGLERMPFGVRGDPFSVTMDNVHAMFAAHEVSRPKRPNEIRVVLVGDSSIWGEGLYLSETLSAQLTRKGLQCNGKTVTAYNLGYPHPSIVKDLVFIDEVNVRQPDAIVWFITMNTVVNQFGLNPFIVTNRQRVLRILEKYDIRYGPRKALSEMENGFYDQTVVGQRSFLARWMKLQSLGLIWAATGMDSHVTPNPTGTMPLDVANSTRYRTLGPDTDLRASLLLNTLAAGRDLSGTTPVLLVDEPIFVVNGMNSDVRYNDLYPRWAFDQYRDLVAAQAESLSMPYLDLWNEIPPEYFTDTPFHLSPEGERLLMEQIAPSLLSMVCK